VSRLPSSFPLDPPFTDRPALDPEAGLSDQLSDQAAEALRSIVADEAFDPDIRSEAAARLAEVDLAQAAAPFPGFAPRAPRGPRAPQAPRQW
jgi:hypothetical protein